MARTKFEARRAPNSIGEAKRDIAAYYAKLVQDKNTPARRHALAYSSLPEETPIPVGFVSHYHQTQKEAAANFNPSSDQPDHRGSAEATVAARP